MTVKKGNEPVFVGMDIKFTEERTVHITMKQYIRECFEAFGEELKGNSNAPAKSDLFTPTSGDLAEELDDERAEQFHHIVSKLLYVSKRVRLDVDFAVSYLCTRVAKSDKGDWDKLRRLLTYLQNTIDMPRIIGTENLDVLYAWVDASYAIHTDMKGHTGGVISIGHGIVHQRSSKQKLNTKSSKETE